MGSITIQERGERVILVNNDVKFGLGFMYDVAIKVGKSMRRKARGLEDTRDTFTVVRIWRDELDICMEQTSNGQLFLKIPAKAAIEIGNVLIQVGKRVEQNYNHARTVEDGAILMRHGMGIGLADDPYLMKQIANEAAWGSARRYLQNNIKQGIQVGTPRVWRPKKPEGALPNG